MHTKIIFFDIDGTILCQRTGLISDSTKAAIQQARANGHLVFINTGRTLAEIDAATKDIGFDGYVCGCGTYISFQDTVLLHTSLPLNLCKELVKDLKEFNIEAVLEGTTATYYNFNSTHPAIVNQRNFFQSVHHFNVQDWDAPDISFDKFCVWYVDKEKGKQFAQKYEGLFDFIVRDGYFYEIVPKGHSKASGIEFLLSHLNISHENTYALGDGTNDLPMLNFVKHSIGMGNSEACVFDVVTFITKDVDQDGVDYALKHFHLI